MARIFTAPVGTARPDHVDEILDPATGIPKHPWKETVVNQMPPGDPEAKVDSEYKRLMDIRGMTHHMALAHLRAKRLSQIPDAGAPRASVRDAPSRGPT